MPAGVRASASVSNVLPLLDVPSAKNWYTSYGEKHTLVSPAATDDTLSEESCISVKNLSFGYKNSKRDIIRNLSLDIKQGSITAIVGGNGAGKSTLLSLICGTLKQNSGKITINGGKIGFLPQDPTLLFNKETLREEFADNADEIAAAFNLTHLLSRHPFDLSGGERQKAALAKLVSYGADILLLDEPTKAADAVYKQMFSALLKQLKADGKTIVIVSHDMDFCAETADICALLFDGEISVSLPPSQFFADSSFFTTDSAKIAKNVCDNVYTVAGLIASLGGRAENYGDLSGRFHGIKGDKPDTAVPQRKKRKKLSVFRKVMLSLGSVGFAFMLLAGTGIFPFEIPSEPFWLQYALLCVPMIMLIIGIAPKNSMAKPPVTAKKLLRPILSQAL